MMNGLPIGTRVLIIEDEAIVAMTVEAMVGALGGRVTATVGTVQEALSECLIPEFDIALLDLNLHGKSSLSVATALLARGIPFIVTTGDSRPDLRGPLTDALVVTKPYRPGILGEAIQRRLLIDRGVTCAQPAPAH